MYIRVNSLCKAALCPPKISERSQFFKTFLSLKLQPSQISINSEKNASSKSTNFFRCVTQRSWAMLEGRFVMSPSLTICSWKFAVKAQLLYLFFRVDHLKIRNVYLNRRLERKKGNPNRRIRAWVQRIGKHEHTSSIASRIKDRFKTFFKLRVLMSKLL